MESGSNCSSATEEVALETWTSQSSYDRGVHNVLRCHLTYLLRQSVSMIVTLLTDNVYAMFKTSSCLRVIALSACLLIRLLGWSVDSANSVLSPANSSPANSHQQLEYNQNKHRDVNKEVSLFQVRPCGTYCRHTAKTLLLVHTANSDKTVLSCLVGGVNWVRDSRRQFSTYWRLNSFAQSCLRCEHIWELVLTQFPNDVTIVNHGNWVTTREDSVHSISRLDKTVSKFLVADSLVLLVFVVWTSHIVSVTVYIWECLGWNSIILLLTTREVAWCIILVVFVCLSVCMYVCQTITFESLDVESSKVLRSRSKEQKRSKINIPAI